MDPITQGVLGAVCAQAPAPRAHRMGWAVCGLLGGLAPDLDVLISSESDPLLFLEYHRQFSHSLLFIPLGALLVAGMAHPLLRRWQDWRATYLACLIGYATHGLLDACTSYGTQLFWPFSDARVAWSVISVVDPLFTVPLIVGLIAGLVSGRRLFRFAVVGWAIGYLLFGAWQHQRALAVADLLAGPISRGDGGSIERLMVKPAFGNLAVWKSVHRQGDRYHVNAIRLVGAAQWCPGDSTRALDVTRDLPGFVEGSAADRELARFRWFSNDYLASDGPREVFDVRYSNVANEIDPLWGIRLDFDSAAQYPVQHPVQWWSRRQVTSAHRDAFIALLRGEGCIPVP